LDILFVYFYSIIDLSRGNRDNGGIISD